MSREHIICMDILNYSSSFFDIPRHEARRVDFELDLHSARNKIESFVHASRAMGFKIIGFIDKSISTKESLDKWYSRRNEELVSGVRYCVANMSIILGSIFQSLGVTVHFSTVDCDDTIAAFAYHLQGSVLSRDCDFFRYYVDFYSYTGTPPFQVFFDFSFSFGSLCLNRHGGPGRRHPASPRQILRRLPETSSSAYFLEQIPDLLSGGASLSFMYKRGCGSNLTHEARPLRQAMYKRKGYSPVLEVIAHWNQRPTFTNDTVHPDGRLDYLLDSPRRAFHHIFPATRRSAGVSEIDWRNHIFCQKCVIAELCAWTSQTPYLVILGQI